MGKDILIRGFGEETYSQINKIAEKKGVSVTSFIKNIIDQKLNEEDTVQQKHDIIIYDDDASMEFLLKSLDRLTKEIKLFQTFCAPVDSTLSKVFTKLKWFDGTITPYQNDLKKFPKYLEAIINKISKKANRRPVCLIDCVLEDIAKTSLDKAIALEEKYNEGRLRGLTFCTYKIDTILKNGITNMLELFTCHDQIFILKNNEIFKMHFTKENTQKLLLD